MPVGDPTACNLAQFIRNIDNTIHGIHKHMYLIEGGDIDQDRLDFDHDEIAKKMV